MQCRLGRSGAEESAATIFLALRSTSDDTSDTYLHEETTSDSCA